MAYFQIKVMNQYKDSPPPPPPIPPRHFYYLPLHVSLNLTTKLHIHVALPSPPQVIPGPLQQTRL